MSFRKTSAATKKGTRLRKRSTESGKRLWHRQFGSAVGADLLAPPVWVHVARHGFALVPGVLHRIVDTVRVPQRDRAAMVRPPAAFAKLLVESPADSCLELF